MAYTRAWDETVPPGTAQANTLETIIQNFKVDLRERLVQVIPEWSNEAVDPKRVKVLAGLAANRPAPAGLADGIMYYSTDTNKLEIIDGAAWIQLSPLDTSNLPPSAVRTIARQNGNQVLTGSIIETTLFTTSVQAGLLGATGWLRVKLHFETAGVAGSKTLRIKFGTTIDVTISLGSGTTESGVIEFLLWNVNVTNVQYAVGTKIIPGTPTVSVDSTGTEDTTAAVTLSITGTLANAGDTINLRSVIVEALPS